MQGASSTCVHAQMAPSRMAGVTTLCGATIGGLRARPVQQRLGRGKRLVNGRNLDRAVQLCSVAAGCDIGDLDVQDVCLYV